MNIVGCPWSTINHGKQVQVEFLADAFLLPCDEPYNAFRGGQITKYLDMYVFTCTF